MVNRIPIRRASQLADIDISECIEGYRDGFGGEPEPGDNRSFSYWHGWRNGASDKKLRSIDEAQRELARDVVKGWKGR